MNIWAIANQKGGVGKTTTTITLAGLLASRGCPTLVVDLDPHGSLTTYLGGDPDGSGCSVYELFAGAEFGGGADLIRQTVVNNLFLLPASTALSTLDRQLGAQHGKGLVLKHALAQLQENFAHVLLDCPPMLGVLMVNALACCDELVIPVQTEFLALKGLERMLHTLKMINHARRHRPLPHLIVPTMLDRRTRASSQTLSTLQERYRQFLWHSYIPVDTQFREASRAGQPISHLAPWSRGARAYSELLSDLLKAAPEYSLAVG
ncbi:MAG: ParA family protein [Gammaproteobacteria bacterium]